MLYICIRSAGAIPPVRVEHKGESGFGRPTERSFRLQHAFPRRTTFVRLTSTQELSSSVECNPHCAHPRPLLGTRIIMFTRHDTSSKCGCSLFVLYPSWKHVKYGGKCAVKPQARTEAMGPVDALRDLVDEIASPDPWSVTLSMNAFNTDTTSSRSLGCGDLISMVETRDGWERTAPPDKTEYAPINRVQAMACAPIVLLRAR